MITIRRNVFETNSSSTHSITICTQKQFDDWKAGKLLFDPYSEKFISGYSDDEEKWVRETASNQYKEEHSYSKFYKTWEELSDDAKEEFIQTKLKSLRPSSSLAMTYDKYRNYYQEECYYTEKFFTTEHGDSIVAFGKGGYDG